MPLLLSQRQQGGNGLYRDPRQMPKTVATSTQVSTAGSGSTIAAFWTQVAASGIAVNSDFAAGTFKTIANLSGFSGELTGVIGPTVPTLGDITSVEFTLDGGVPIIVQAASIAATQRVYLGPYFTSGAGGPGGGVAHDIVNMDALRQTENSPARVPSPMACRTFGLSRLRFNSSLLVRISTSVAVNGTANQERQSGVLYVRD